MKKILIIGAGVEQVPAVQIAKELGHHVIVTDYNPNAPAIPMADEYYFASTDDASANLKIAQKHKIDGVLTVCSETAVPSVAHVADQLGLRSYSPQTALRATNKLEMRKALAGTRVSVAPWLVTGAVEEARAFAQKIPGPWMIKPIDSSGQRGMKKITSPEDLPDFIPEAIRHSPSGQVLIDQYLIGPEYHVTMWVQQGQVHFVAISDRITLDSPHDGIAVRHIAPSLMDRDTRQKIQDLCTAAIQAIGHDQGVATCEVILHQGQPYLMEVAVRVPGGYLREVAWYLSGTDIVRATILDSLGLVHTIDDIQTDPSHPAVHVEFITRRNVPPAVSEIRDIMVPSGQKGDIKLINWHVKTPFTPPPLTTSVGRFGAIVTTGATPAEAIARSKQVFDNICVNGTFHLTPETHYSPDSLKTIEKQVTNHPSP